MRISDKQVFVGCDISKKTLDFAVHRRECPEKAFPHVQVANTLEGFRAFKKWIKGLGHSLDQVVVFVEHTGVYGEAVCDYLFKMKISFCLVNPTSIKASFAIAKGKDDKIDSQRLAKYGYKEREDLNESTPVPMVIRRIRNLLSERRAIVKAKVAIINRCKTIAKTTNTYKRGIKIVEEFKAQIKAVEHDILAIIESDEAIKRNFDLLRSVTCIGLINAASTIVATENFSRFSNARQYASFICVAPFHHTSGISVHGATRVSKKGHTELKTDLTLAARAAIQNYPEFRAYFDRKSAEGKSYGTILNAVKFKLITRMFAVIKRGVPYVDSHKHTTIDPLWNYRNKEGIKGVITDNVSRS